MGHLDAFGRAMHEAWLEVMAEQGYHSWRTCGLYATDECDHCRGGLIPWDDVPDSAKEINRRGALGFLSHLYGRPVSAEEADRLEAGVIGAVRESLREIALGVDGLDRMEIGEKATRALRLLGAEDVSHA